MSWIPETTGLDRFLMLISLKAGLVLGLAWVIAQALRWMRRSPASRHVVWTLAAGGVILLPILVNSLPSWHIAVLEESPVHGSVRNNPVPGSVTVSAAPAGSQMDATVATRALVTPRAQAPAVLSAGPSRVDASPLTAESDRPAARPPLLSSIWLIVAGLMMVPTILGRASLWRLERSSSRVTSGPLSAALQHSTGVLGMKGTVRLLAGKAGCMPMTWGVLRPVILLPEEAHRWTEERLRIVLLHELAHVLRRDCLWQLVAQVARALYWFNPLSWIMERQLRALMEQACDDLVLTGGFDAPDYADHVLAISASCRPPAWGVGMAMARTSKLERRLAFILSSCREHRPITRRRLAVALIVSSALLVPLSIARLAPAVAIEPSPAGAGQDAPPVNPATDSSLKLDELRAKIAEQYVTPVDDREIVQSAIKAMLGALHDPYCDYLPPQSVAEMERQIGGTLAGIGAQLEAHDGKIRVVTPLPDSPALDAGLETGDFILKIDGASTAGLELSEAVKRIVGSPGSQVQLTISREGAPETEINITRRLLQISSVKGFRRGSDHHWELLLDPGHRIGYVRLAQLGSNTPLELRDALEKLKARGLAGMILDLRFCPGGLLESAVAVARLFLAQGTIVSIHGRGGEPKVISADGSSVLDEIPLIVLVNGQTASAAEIVAGALKDNHRALVVGTRTLGKGSVQSVIALDEGSGAIKLTTARYQLTSGRTIDRGSGESSWGIEPDEGFFIPMDPGQAGALTIQQQRREVIPRRADARADHDVELTPQWIEREEGDLQLAAALGALIARIESGRFSPVSRMSPSEIETFLKREELQRRRSVLEKDLERIQGELKDLEKETPARN